MYEKIYKDFSDWLKFTEAKILAVITIQLGFLYFICKLDSLSNKVLLMSFGVISCLILIYSLVPKLNSKSENVLYYGAWVNKKVITKGIKVSDSNYWYQCVDLAKIIKKKIYLLRLSIFLIGIQVLIIFYPFAKDMVASVVELGRMIRHVY